ncbi:hypothetical protein AKH21_03155 [Pelagibacteraceae bacterium GOM-A5]|nr:hypothetical protein AKH21_03155 [Pelagibacteraceae bacterium GOM-A5]|tara:strand:+ start:105 stop:629 length:525 start_codon:yes stop_codon:yes gene_type:complete
MNTIKITIVKILISFLLLNSCADGLKGADARKIPANMTERQRQNIEEGRGFTLGSLGGSKAGEFDFASSNELWRASLDTLDFMPLSLANYSGGIIVTDWYSSDGSVDESVKISVRFLSNEIRSDSLAIKVFYKKCSLQKNCQITDKTDALSNDIENKILTKAAVYEKENKSKKK